MRIRNFESQLWLPRPREEIFAFFADATNLDLLTPGWLKFHTTTPQPIVMRAGTLIDYQLRLRGIPIRWRTEIKVWEPPNRFVDEQIRGPYRLWVHEHIFEEHDGGTLVQDRVRYAVPFDFFAYKFLVRPDVERIFAFRTQGLRKRFGTSNGRSR